MEARKVFEIVEWNREGFEAQIAVLNRKAKRLGTAPIVVTVLGTEDRRVVLSEADMFAPECERPLVRFVKVTIDGEVPMLHGWAFVGVLTPASSGPAGTNLVRTLGAFEVPEKFRTSGTVCDHCRTNRKRSETFLLRNDATGEFRQIGRTCLADFTGANDPEKAAAAAGYLATAFDLAEDAGEVGMGGGRGYLRADVSEFLALVASFVRRIGFTSRKDAAMGGTATADEVWSFLFTRPRTTEEDRERDEARPTDADKALAAEALAWGKAFADKATRSDFEHNVAAVAAAESITFREIGIAAAIVPCYLREKARKIEREAAVVSRPVGTVGERLRNLPARIADVRVMDGEFGTTTLVKFIDANGNRLAWFASGLYEFEIGAAVKVTGTVKAHKEYKGAMETTLSRCVVVEG